MTVAELKKVLERADPESQILVSAYDHKYNQADAFLCKALYSSEYREWSEYYGERHREPHEDELHAVVVVQ